jgi:hypothetical protein
MLQIGDRVNSLVGNVSESRLLERLRSTRN